MMAGAATATPEIVHTAIDAIVAGPDADGSWRSVCNGTPETPAPNCPYPLESVSGRSTSSLMRRLKTAGTAPRNLSSST